MVIDNLKIVNNTVTGYHGKESRVVIPEGITEIGEAAFKGCTWLKSVSIKSSVFRSIGMEAFDGCENLEEITITSLRGAIGDRAFRQCAHLENIDIPYGAMEIGDGAFSGCSGLCCVSIPDSVMVIAKHSFDTLFSKKLLLLCDDQSEAAKYAETRYIPHRQNLDPIRDALNLASKNRKALETRVFRLFGQKISAPNSLALHFGVPCYYEGQKDNLFNLFISRLPRTLTDIFEAKKILDDLQQYSCTTMNRLEEHGIFTIEEKVLMYGSQVLDLFTTLIKTIDETRKELIRAGDSHLENRRDQLVSEAESKVTGLSYGVVGDSLSLALHAVDDFRAKQRQRRTAYAEAQRQFDHESTQVNAKLKEEYERIYQEHIIPVVRTATDAYLDALCRAEICLLKEYGLLEDIADGAYDQKKSDEIIKRASSMDKEYAVGLALKMYPINVKALSFAGTHNLATDELLEYISFMKIDDVNVIADVFRSERITLAGLVNFCKFSQVPNTCKLALISRCEPVGMRIRSMACGKSNAGTAVDFQKQIGEMITPDLWVEINGITPILPHVLVERLNTTQDAIGSADGFASLGQRIAVYNSKYAQSEQRAIGIASSDVSLPEKIAELYAEHEILESQKISDLLRAELTVFTQKVFEEQLRHSTA